MREIVLVAALSGVAFLSACQAQPAQPPGLRGAGWRMGSDLGPMMAYGYCPGSGGRDAGGWYGPGMMGGHMGGGMMGGGMMGGGAFDPEQTSAWLEQAKTSIGVTPAQEEAWSAYADAVAADRAAMLEMHSQMPAMMMSGPNASDRLQAHLDIMATRLSSLQRVNEATQALYAVLTPEQSQRADDALWSGCW